MFSMVYPLISPSLYFSIKYNEPSKNDFCVDKGYFKNIKLSHLKLSTCVKI